MALTEHLRVQHAELIEVLRAIAGRLDAPARGAADIRAELTVLADKLGKHLRLEDDVLYPILAEHDADEVRTLGQRFVAEMSGVRPSFASFSDRWSADAIAADPATFATEARTLFAVIEDRIARENRELYPVADVAALTSRLCVPR